MTNCDDLEFYILHGSLTLFHWPFAPSLARPERIELPTCWFEASRSIRLSYGRPSADFRLPIFDCRFYWNDPPLSPQIDNPKSQIGNGSWGERRDSNPQPLEPQSSALTS